MIHVIWFEGGAGMGSVIMKSWSSFGEIPNCNKTHPYSIPPLLYPTLPPYPNPLPYPTPPPTPQNKDGVPDKSLMNKIK